MDLILFPRRHLCIATIEQRKKNYAKVHILREIMFTT